MSRDIDCVVGLRQRAVAVFDECSPIIDGPLPNSVARTACLNAPPMLGCIAEDALEDDEPRARFLSGLSRERVHARMQHRATAHDPDSLLKLAPCQPELEVVREPFG